MSAAIPMVMSTLQHLISGLEACPVEAACTSLAVAQSTMPSFSPSARAAAHSLMRATGSFTYEQFTSLQLIERLDASICRRAGPEASRKLLFLAFERTAHFQPWTQDGTITLGKDVKELDELIARGCPSERISGLTEFVAQVLDLLYALIGVELTAQLIDEAWPQLAVTTRANSSGS